MFPNVGRRTHFALLRITNFVNPPSSTRVMPSGSTTNRKSFARMNVRPSARQKCDVAEIGARGRCE